MDMDFTTRTSLGLTPNNFSEGMTIRAYGHATPRRVVVTPLVSGEFTIQNDGAANISVKRREVIMDVAPGVTQKFQTEALAKVD